MEASSLSCLRASCPDARVSCHLYTIVAGAPIGASTRPARPGTLSVAMSPFWIWTQIAIVVFVLIGMIVAITKLT
jgi:hypothetical protein